MPPTFVAPVRPLDPEPEALELVPDPVLVAVPLATLALMIAAAPITILPLRGESRPPVSCLG